MFSEINNLLLRDKLLIAKLDKISQLKNNLQEKSLAEKKIILNCLANTYCTCNYVVDLQFIADAALSLNKRRTVYNYFDWIDMTENKYIKAFIENYVAAFRCYNVDKFVVTINGLNYFINKNKDEIDFLTHQLALYGIEIKFEGNIETIDVIDVSYINLSSGGNSNNVRFRIQDVSSLIVQSSKTDIPLTCLIILKSVAALICKIKTLYKAIVLDLDDTLWNGTLSEVGIEQIKINLNSDSGKPFIDFMKFAKGLAEELGVFIAICSRNNIKEVESAIEELDDDIFPIKRNIDYIIANNNDKSLNINLIAEKLSILPDSIVFVDDNSIIRNEVRNKLPMVFVPEWSSHDELMTILMTVCCFNRNILSISAQKKRSQFKVLQTARMQNSLPQLFVKVNRDDTNHTQAKELYNKSNQFKLISEFIDYEHAQSIFFEIYRSNGENLGVCSTLTYTTLNNSACGILNWAISCRYFEIGLEEFIILFLLESMGFKEVHFACQNKSRNLKAHTFIEKYYGEVFLDSCDSVPFEDDIVINQFEYDKNFKNLLLRLRDNGKEFNIYSVNEDIGCRKKLRQNTNLKML